MTAHHLQQQQHMLFTMDVVAPQHQDILSTGDIEKVCGSEDDRSLEMDEVTAITESEMTEIDVASHTSSSSCYNRSVDDDDDDNDEDESDETCSKLSDDPLLQTPCFSSVPTGRRSILKRGVSDGEIYVHSKRGSWKSLPSPDLDAIRLQLSASRSLEASNGSNDCSERPRSSVAFGSIMIRSYSQTLGDNPSVSYGPPIQLDWDYEEHEPLEVDQYEDNRPPRRSPRQMVLSYYHRKNVLTWKYGVSDDELKTSKKQIKREKLRRTITITALPIMHVEAALESAARKAKRVFGKKNNSNNHAP